MKKPTYRQLERQNKELMASLAICHAQLLAEIKRLGTDRMVGSGVLMQLSLVGGKEMTAVMIRDGLSADTIEALSRDIERSRQLVMSGV